MNTSQLNLNSPRAHRAFRVRGLLAALAAASTLATLAQSPTLIPAHTTYFPGEDIVFTFAGGPGNSKDWIGLYPEGIEPGSQASTRWFYVDGTTTGTQGLREGTVSFAGGLNLAGPWTAYLLLNDGYTKLAQASLTVVDPVSSLVRTDLPAYTTGQAISVSFLNGYANPKDWIGIYKAGETPGGPGSTLWAYVDGTKTGTTGLANGTILFEGGLANAGDYVVFFLLDDSYDVLASEPFKVVPPAATVPRILSVQPSHDTVNQPPGVSYVATITNGTTQVVAGSVSLKLNGVPVAHQFEELNGLVTIRYTPTTLLPASSTNTYLLYFADNAAPANEVASESTFRVATYRNIVLPAPLYFEDFDSTAEETLPAGWTQTSYTEVVNPDPDLGNLDSASYAKWIVVDAARFQGSFVTYSNPDNPEAWEQDYRRVLSVNPVNVVNGQVFNQPLASGRFAFGNSGYRQGIGQVVYLFTPDFNLSGKTDVHLAFHSLWEQNQDSLAALEYSVNQGQTWHPIAYFLDQRDIMTVTNEITGEVSVDAVATFTEPRGDAARYLDPDTLEEKGGNYGAFLGAPITPELAPFLQGRVDDDPVESKRIELYRLPGADNQPAVRFRFAHAGVDSWYFGIDNLGLYSIPSGPGERPTLTIRMTGDQVTVSWPADATGFFLQSASQLDPGSWTPVNGVTGHTFTTSATGTAAYYRLAQ